MLCDEMSTFERPIIVTAALEIWPEQVKPVLIELLRLLQLIVDPRGSLWVEPATSSAQERLEGKVTVNAEPIGILFADVTVIMRLPVVFAVLGENVAMGWLNAPGVRVTAANGSLAELSKPTLARKADVVRAGLGFSTFDITKVTSEIYCAVSMAPLTVIVRLPGFDTNEKVLGMFPPMRTKSQLSLPLKINSTGKFTMSWEPAGTSWVFQGVLAISCVNCLCRVTVYWASVFMVVGLTDT